MTSIHILTKTWLILALVPIMVSKTGYNLINVILGTLLCMKKKKKGKRAEFKLSYDMNLILTEKKNALLAQVPFKSGQKDRLI